MVVELKPSKQYPGGGDFVKYTPEGGSFAFYPSGRMAIAFERMGGGFYVFMYADSAAGMTLAAFDPFGCGYAAHESNGKPLLTSRKNGGTVANLQGDLERTWSTSKPLKEPIELELTSCISLRFTSRLKISARLSAQGVAEDYNFGEAPTAQEGSYLQKSLGVIKMGPERGKHMLDIDACREAARARRELRELRTMKDLGVAATLVTEDSMQKLPDLRPIVASADALKQSVQRGEWSVEVCNSKSTLRASFGASLPTLLLSDATLRGNPHSRSLEGMAATNPETFKALVPEYGAIYHGEGGSDSQRKGVLPLTAVLKNNSGRYRAAHGVHYRTPRRRLRELKCASYDIYLQEGAPKGSMVVVCCLAGWLPQSKRMEPVLEMLNGEMHEHAKAREEGGSGARAADPAARAGGPLQLCKYEMSESRFLRDRHNINTLPMFLMYYDGKLCYANSTLNGYGTGREDLLAQVAATRLNAHRGAFLPPDFRFGATSDNRTAQFSETLTKTSTKLRA